MKTKTINLSLPAEMLKKIDRAAKTSQSNRSEFIRQSARRQLETLENWERICAYGARQGRKLGIKSEDDVERLIDEGRK